MENVYEVARPLTAAELPGWLSLANAMAENNLPVMGLGCHVIGRLASTRRGRAACSSVGKIAVAVGATLCFPEQESFDVVRSAMVVMPEVALDAYEELLREVRPIVHEIVLAERLRRSGSLTEPWRFVHPQGEPPTPENMHVQVCCVKRVPLS